jgi:superfamily II helicase
MNYSNKFVCDKCTSEKLIKKELQTSSQLLTNLNETHKLLRSISQ